MAEKKLGKQTVRFEKCPYIIGSAAVGGKKEGEGPLKSWLKMTCSVRRLGKRLKVRC